MSKSVRLCFAVLSTVSYVFGSAVAQMIELREVDGKTITCTRTGLSSDLKDCGVQSDWYSYVFVGSISAIKPVSSDEMELQIIPEEVFHDGLRMP